MKSQSNPSGLPAELALGIPEIDEQHQAFFSLLERITSGPGDKFRPLDDDAVDAMLDSLAEVRDLALDHFETEEALMEEVAYPGLEEQCTAHGRFIADLDRLEGELMNGTAVPPVKIQQFLTQWSREHVLAMDKAFSIFYKKTKE